MSNGNPGRQTPLWLSSHWERKKNETVDRVRAAIERLAAEQRPVTVNAIREKVKEIFAVPFSANTIKRNEQAYALYQSFRRPNCNPAARDILLRDLYAQASDRTHLYAKVARLRRQSKDHLIAQLIALEQESKLHADLENRLREEIIQNSLPNAEKVRVLGAESPRSSGEKNAPTKATDR